MPDDELLSNDPQGPSVLSQSGGELLNNEEGWVVGAYGEKLLRVPTDKHMITMANTGGGKGVSVAIPNLLTHEGSVFSVEIGGATFHATSKFRKHILGQDIHVIDPFGATGQESACVNLLETLDPNSPRFFVEVRSFANSLLKSETGAKASDPFWERAPLTLLIALLLYVRTSPDVAEEDRTLVYVSKLLAQSQTPAWLKLMQDFAEDYGPYCDTLNEVGNKLKGDQNITTYGVVASVSHAFISFQDPKIAAISKKSSFPLEDLRRKKCTAYVVMPEIGDYTAHATWLRLLVERAFAACPNFGDGGRNFQHSDRVLFLLDEFTQLGKLDAVDTGMQTARQKGITIWALFQDLGRLQEVYGENTASSFLGAAGVTQVFDVGDQRTPKYVSERLGRRVVHVPSVQYGWNGGENSQKNWSTTKGTAVTDGFSRGVTVGETENWNFSLAEGTSQSHTRTTSSGTSDNESIDTSPKNILGLPTLDYKNGPKMHNFFGAQKKTYGRTKNEGTQESYQTGSQTTSTTSQGGAKTTSTTDTTQNSKTTSDGTTDGGSAGQNSGWQYSITLTPHIVPGLDPAEVEQVLGSGNNQILFIRTKHQVMRLLQQRAIFYEVPRLNRYSKGDFSLPAPTNPYRPLARIEARSAGGPVTLDMQLIPQIHNGYKRLSYDVVSPLTSSGKGAQAGAHSPQEYTEALQSFQSAVQVKNQDRIRSSQEELYQVFLSSAPAIDDESIKTKECIESQRTEIAKSNDRLAALKEILVEQERTIREARTKLVVKAQSCADLSKKVEETRRRALEELKKAEEFSVSAEDYQGYLRILVAIAEAWKGTYAPARPQIVPNVSTQETIRPGKILQMIGAAANEAVVAVPNPQIAPVNWESVTPFDVDELDRIAPKIGAKLGANKVQIGNNSVTITRLQEIIRERRKATGLGKLTIGKNEVGLTFLRNLQYARDNKMVEFLTGIKNYQDSSTQKQSEFKNWVGRSDQAIQKNINSLIRYREELELARVALETAEKQLDVKICNLNGQLDRLYRADEMVQGSMAQTHNAIVAFEAWSELEQQGATVVNPGSDARTAQGRPKRTDGIYDEIRPFFDDDKA